MSVTWSLQWSLIYVDTCRRLILILNTIWDQEFVWDEPNPDIFRCWVFFLGGGGGGRVGG